MKDKRIELFLNMLLNEDDYQPTEYYAKALNVSNKSIYNYLGEIEPELEKMELSISRKAGVGLRLKLSQNEKRVVKETLFSNLNLGGDERVSQIKKRIIMFDETVSIRKLADEYYVSATSIFNDLEAIESELNASNLELIRNHKGTKLGGPEQNIRNEKFKLVYESFNERREIDKHLTSEFAIGVMLDFFDEQEILIAKEMISFMVEKLDFTIELNYYIQTIVYFTIFVNRISNCEYLIKTVERPIATELHILKTYPIAIELANHLIEKYNFSISEYDIRWLNARIAGVYHERNDLQGSVEQKEVKKIVEELVLSTKDIFNANLLNDTVLIKGLEKHFIPLISRITNNVKVINPLIDQIKEQYTAMYSVIWLACSLIENELDVKLSEDEISFILIHFQAALERQRLSKKIAIVGHANGIERSLMLNRIKSNVPTFDVLEFISYEEIEDFNEILDGFDFVISDEEIEGLYIPLVIISPYVSDKDIENIKDVYFKVSKDEEGKFRDIQKILTKETIFLHSNCANMIEVLQLGNDALLSIGSVKEEFYDSMLNREYQSPTEVGKGIVIPHGQGEYVHKTSISIITLQEPIVWKNDLIRIAFILAINLDEKERARKLLKDLYYIISNDELINQLCNATNVNEVLSYIGIDK